MKSFSITNIIGKLYSVTLTPQGKEISLYESNIDELVKYIQNLFSPERNGPTISENDIKTCIFFFLRLVNTPTSLRGALLIKPCLIYLTKSACEEARVSQNASDEIMSFLIMWFKALENSPDAASIYLKKPDIKESPLFRFHIDAYTYSKTDDATLPSFYRAYAYILHKKIRLNERQNIDYDTHLSYIRAARYFFKYMPDDIKSLTNHPQVIPENYIDLFARRLDINEKKNYDGPLSSLAITYKKKLKALIIGKTIKPHPHEGARFTRKIKEGFPQNVPADGTLTILTPKIHTPDIAQRIYRLEAEKALEYETDEEVINCEKFEADYELQMYELPEKDLITPQKPSLKKGWEDLINLRSFNFYWDSNYLNLFHYAVMYQTMIKLWNTSSFDNANLTFIEILIHTGIHPKKLIDLTTTIENTDKEFIQLQKVEERYHILIESIVKYRRTIDHPACFKTSSTVWVPLPDRLSKLLSHLPIHQSPFVFSYVTSRNRIKRLSLLDVENYIEKNINNAYPEYELKITLAKIYRSFLPLYHHRFGLDPLVCTLISGEDHHRLYRSQLHYVYIEHKRLAKEYLETHNKVTSAIKENLYNSIQFSFLDKNRFSQEEINKFITHNRAIESLDKISVPQKHDFGYGSPLICKKEYIINLVSSLRHAIINETNPLKRHNFYSIYVYLCLQFSTCLRPRNNPDILWADYNEHSNVIAICDKQSVKYNEERFLPITTTLKTLLTHLHKGFRPLRLHLAEYYYPPLIKFETDKIFFFIEEKTGKIIDFTLKKLKEHLKNIGIDYSLPLNMPRHFLRNYLYHLNLSNDLIDYWMGHQHISKELLNSSSSVLAENAIDTALTEIDSLLNELGFTVLDYLPRNIKWNASKITD